MAASLALVASFMALEVGIVAAYGDSGILAGAAIAVASAGSLIGGLAFGHRRIGVAGVVAALTLVGVGVALFGVVEHLALQFIALFVSGLGFAPAMSVLYIMVSHEIPEHAASEAFGWLTSAALAGGAIGTAIAGVATDAHGPDGAVAVSVVLAAFAAVSPLIARIAGPLRGLANDTAEESDTVDDLCVSSTTSADE